VKLFWVGIGEYYQKHFTENQVRMYTEDTEHFSVADLNRAFTVYRAENKFPPLPGDLTAILKPRIDEKSEALEAVSLIWEAVARFGWPNGKDARAHIGELGWKVVERFGGWTTVCDQADSDGGILRAQMRDLAIAMQSRAKAGLNDTLPSLPGPTIDRRVLDLVAKALPVGDALPHEHRHGRVSNDQPSSVNREDRVSINREGVDSEIGASE